MQINRLTDIVYVWYRPEESWFIPIKFIQAGTTDPFDFGLYDLELSVWNKTTNQFSVINTELDTTSKIICSRKFIDANTPQENGIQLEHEDGSLFTIYYDIARNIAFPIGVYTAHLVATMPINQRQVDLVTFEITVTNEKSTIEVATTTINDYTILPIKNLEPETIIVPIRTIPILNLV
jgi:hypothetical protein